MSNSNAPQFQPTANLNNLDRFLATPAIWTPGMSDEEWSDQTRNMFVRSIAAHEFVSGNLSPSDFEEVLFQTGYDPHVLAEQWEEGESLL